MTHWATAFIGLPWRYGAQGPDEFDCWGFFRHVQSTQFNIDAPLISYEQDWRDSAKQLDDHAERDNWIQVQQPQEGDAVLMGRSRLPVHIGIWIEANGTQGVLHCLERVGVHFTPARSLRAEGWGHLSYYRHKTKCTS